MGPIPVRASVFLFPKTTSLLLGSTQFPIQSKPGASSPRLKLTAYFPSLLRVRKRGSYPHSSIRLHIMHKNNFTLPPRALTAQFYKKVNTDPLQAWSGPEGSRKLKFPDFMTTAQDGGKVISLTHRLPLPPVNTPGTHFC